MQTTTIIVDGKKQKIKVSAAGLRAIRKNAKADAGVSVAESK